MDNGTGIKEEIKEARKIIADYEKKFNKRFTPSRPWK